MGADLLKPSRAGAQPNVEMNAPGTLQQQVQEVQRVQQSQTLVAGQVAPRMEDSSEAIKRLLPNGGKPTLLAKVVKVDPATGRWLELFDPKSITVQSGDQFVFHYLTNVGGLILAQSFDSANVESELGESSVGPMAPNLLPTDSPAFELDPKSTGLETFRVLFQPCLNAAQAAKDAGSAYKAIAEAMPSAGSFTNKAIIKATNRITIASASAMLAPGVSNLIPACDAAALHAAAKQPLGSVGSDIAYDNGIAIASASTVRIVELVIRMNHISKN